MGEEQGALPAAPAAPAVLSLKAREEGVVAAVHAFNVLRLAFHDTHLATDTSAFCAPGLQAAVAAARSPHWEVRNAAGLCLVALLHRMLGFKNVARAGRPWGREAVVCRQTARQSMTAFEFFHRYPSLHGFFLTHLQDATLAFLPVASLTQPPSCTPTTATTVTTATTATTATTVDTIANTTPTTTTNSSSSASASPLSPSQPLHPSLAPALILLSRLKPSTLTSPSASAYLSPAAFVPPVTLCAAHPHMHVRELAARALVPIVAPTEVSRMLLMLACSLPEERGGAERGSEGGDEKRSARGSDEADARRDEKGTESESESTGVRMSFNAVHGVLLQMRHLLAAYWASGTGQQQQQQEQGGTRASAVLEVLLALQQRQWLGDPRVCCCHAVVAEYLTVAHLLLSSALHSSPPLSSLLSSARSSSSTPLSSPPLSPPLLSSPPPLTPVTHTVASFFLPLALRAFSLHPPVRFAMVDPTALALRQTAAALLLSPEAVCLAGRGLWEGMGGVEGMWGGAGEGEGGGLLGKAGEGERGECGGVGVFWRVVLAAICDPSRDVQLSALRSLAHLLASPHLLAPLLPPHVSSTNTSNGGNGSSSSSSSSGVGEVLLAVLTGVQQERSAHGRDEMRCRRQLKVLLAALSLPALRPLLLPLLPLALLPGGAPLAGQAGQTQQPVGPSQVPDSTVCGRAAHCAPASHVRGPAALWRVVLEIFETARVLKTREAALRCLGHCFRLLLLDHSPDEGFRQQQQEQQGVLKQSMERELTQGNFSLGQGKGSGNLLQLAATWLQLIGEQSSAHRPVSVRRAAAEAVVSSGLLLDAGRVGAVLRADCVEGGESAVGGEEGERGGVMEYACVVLRAWLTVIRVMEDEDETLRKTLAAAILTITTTAPAAPAVGTIAADMPAPAPSFVPAQVERALEAAFAHLSQCFRGCPPCLLPAHLAAWILHPDFVSPKGFRSRAALEDLGGGGGVLGEKDEEEVQRAVEGEREGGKTGAAAAAAAAAKTRAAAAGPAVPGFVRKLFDREVDNHHEEPLLLAHLCCLHLHRALHHCARTPALLAALATWKLTFAGRFFSEAAQAAQLFETMRWVGGPTFHQDSFSALIRPLLGLWALSKLSFSAAVSAKHLPLGWGNKGIAQLVEQSCESNGGDGSECETAASLSRATGKDIQRTWELIRAAAGKLQGMPVNPILASVLSDVIQANGDDGTGEGDGVGVRWDKDVLWCDPLFLLHAQSYGM
ncbi:hypothetical protein CLOM_g10921 [Closterium sp. NIES-68]|nr:hypothetical protein CLOM_g10921 [Closterium sp. NIES-68]GJP57785.1 hypothetical protein CLOP_g17379 [Closterium sp. NIES-67]